MAFGNKFTFSLVAAGLGFAGGYLFSSKFCTVTIAQRVDKKIALNQALRTAFMQNTIFNQFAARAKLFNTPDQQDLQNLVSQSQEEITTLLAAYYGKQAIEPLHELLMQRNNLLQNLVADKTGSLTQLRADLKQNGTDIARALSILNPDVSGLSFGSYLNQQEALAQENALALQRGNYQTTNSALLKQIDTSGRIADELNNAITQQFRARF